MKQTIIKAHGCGRITCSTKKLRGRKKRDLKTVELRNFTRKKLRNLTKSEKHYDHGVFKNARIMGKPKEPFHQNFEMEVHQGGVNYPYDKRCHPYINPKSR